MKIDFYSRAPHYIDHMKPIWDSLPKQYKGLFLIPKEIVPYAESIHLDYTVGEPRHILTLVAGYDDLTKCKGPAVFMEHGVGFTFSGRQVSYAGGTGRENVVLFLNNHELTEARNSKYYPNAHHVIIGTPKLDHIPVSNTDGKTVCISFHWDCKVAPETGSAFHHYREIIPIISENPNINLIMHGHPRLMGQWQEYIRIPGIPMYENFVDVMRIADVYVNDSSSTMYEFAATGKPVIVLNDPKFRRNINHGLRFWESIPGPQVDNPNDLEEMILRTLEDLSQWDHLRVPAIERVYPYFGESAQRAADVIVHYMDTVYIPERQKKFKFLLDKE